MEDKEHIKKHFRKIKLIERFELHQRQLLYNTTINKRIPKTLFIPNQFTFSI